MNVMLRAAKEWHKKHLAHLKERGLTKELFEQYVATLKKTMQQLQLPEARVQSAAHFIEAAW